MSGPFGKKKHQRKVLECYPLPTGPHVAVGGKLSSLIYYINAKPSKLLKVSAYLEKKVPKDLTRESPQYNKITLDIIESIMHGCSEYFVSFAPSVLRIILFYTEALLTDELIIRLHLLFMDFCRMTKAILPSIREIEFFDMHTRVLRRLLREPIQGQSQVSTEILGKDVMAAVGMEDFRGPGGRDRLGIIASTVIDESIRSDSFKRSEDLERLIQHRSTSIAVSGEQDGPFLMGLAFVILCEDGNSSTIPLIVNTVFEQFDTSHWSHPHICTIVLTLFVRSAPAQYLCVILSEFFKKMDKSDDFATSILADVISELLRSNRSPLGYSALELTRNFLKVLRKQKPSLPLENNNRMSLLKTQVSPPRTIFSICNAFVSLLKNATFVLQKYEIIESILLRAFFPIGNPYGLPNEAGSTISATMDSSDRHSIGTVTLDNREESHYRSVVWGILFTLAEEGASSSVLRLTSSDVHIRLFEMIFRMANSQDGDFCLNALVFWQRLVIHGLSFSSSLQKRDNNIESGSTLSKSSIYVITKSRIVLGNLLIPGQNDIATIMHVSAIFSLVREIIRSCDLLQLANCLNFTLWIFLQCKSCHNLTFEDRIYVSMFTNYVFEDISKVLQGNSPERNPLKSLVDSKYALFKEYEIELVNISDILDSSRSGTVFGSGCEFSEESFVTNPIEVRAAFLASLYLESSVNSVNEILHQDYNLEEESKILPTIQPSLEKLNTTSTKFSRNYNLLPISSERSVTGTFSRLSKIGGGGGSVQSAVTAPAFYSQNSHVPSASYLAPASRTATMSSSSLSSSSDFSSNTAMSSQENILSSPFEEMSIRAKEQRQREHTKSVLYSNKDST